jgi:TRAP-type C4-dicarboxylate transport system permease small subunit
MTGVAFPHKGSKPLRIIMTLTKAKKAMDGVVDWVCIGLLAIATAVCFYQVVSRYVFSSPPSWSEEIARYLFVWLTFLGSAIAFRYGAHLALGFTKSLLPVNMHRWVSLVSLGVVAGVLVFVIWQGKEATQFASRQLTPALQLSMSIPYLAIPVGGFFMLIEVLWNMLHLWQERRL